MLMRKVTTLYLYVWSSFKTSPYFMSVFMSANYWVVELLCYCLNESKPMCDFASHSRSEVLVRCALYQAGLQAGQGGSCCKDFLLQNVRTAPGRTYLPFHSSTTGLSHSGIVHQHVEVSLEVKETLGKYSLRFELILPRISLHGFGYQLHLDVRIA